MPRDSVFFTVFHFFSFMFSPHAYGDVTDWKVYASDEIATHHYEFKEIEHLTKDVVIVSARIIPLGNNRASLKDTYGIDGCEGIDFQKIEAIECLIEIDCLNRTYRVTESLFEDKLEIEICEPRNSVSWKKILLGSPIDKLLKIVCL